MVESTGLENRRCESIRGFESHSLRQTFISHSTMQKYPSGRRGSPAKGVGGLKTRARVQIPPSAPKRGHTIRCCPLFLWWDLKPKRVSSVKKTCRWHVFSCEVRSSYAARTDYARRSRSGIIPPSAPSKRPPIRVVFLLSTKKWRDLNFCRNSPRLAKDVFTITFTFCEAKQNGSVRRRCG